MSRVPNSTKKKALLLLALGIKLGFDPSPIGHIRAWRMFGKEWKDINKEALRRSIREFYNNRLVEFQKNKDGTISIIATETGKKKAVEYRINDALINKPHAWDQKWRAVIFDIPEEKRLGRDILRRKIKNIGFYELQKSVWIYPYDCEDIINFLTDFYKIQKYVRYIIIEKITNDENIKSHFSLK